MELVNWSVRVHALVLVRFQLTAPVPDAFILFTPWPPPHPTPPPAVGACEEGGYGPGTTQLLCNGGAQKQVGGALTGQGRLPHMPQPDPLPSL